MEDSVFTKILKREIPAEIIYEDECAFVIPDKFPSMEGQVLVIPTRQAPYLFELSDNEYTSVMEITRRVAQALDRAYSTLRTCMVVEGFEVPHVHIRLYPCRTEELRLAPRREAPSAELNTVAEKVRAALARV